LADEVHEGGLFAGAVVGDGFGVGGDGLVGEGVDGGGVADLGEALGFDDFGGVVACALKAGFKGQPKRGPYSGRIAREGTEAR
jgi:hypothetical protein